MEGSGVNISPASSSPAPHGKNRPTQEDRPLSGAAHPDHPLHWTLYGCEMVATAVMMICGIVAVAVLTVPQGIVGAWLVPHPIIQTALCGLFFGLSGTVAAITPFGKVSGAHLNPSVSLAFALAGKLGWIDLCGYIIAQVIGACLGTWLLACAATLFPFWGHLVTAAGYAATVPAQQVPILWPLVTELVLTALLILMLYWLAGHPRFKELTPWAGGLFFLLLNPVSAWLSGNSSNLARSFAPAVFSGQWTSFWIYAIGPFAGASLSVLAIRTHLFGHLEVEEARLVNFGHHGRVPSLWHPTRKRAETGE
ncbi:aquaporin [Gluconacetobacter entanii]|uniref:Aquaporin n=1 Tax=Gluconacetobacter entanii TaxID=108528 RepID=A0ABT3K3D9_9PROT|nr:aquaporin [Gluconacetobacter entanii]MCW4589898.1 aquaporin [Gluconacetobacter entanii]MCW4594864.1 aquaporin [Gluconacetobacter entanii]NPC88460.1 porin [Gluconacetobacter entanii]